MILPFLDKMPNIHPSAYIADSADIIGDVIVGKESSVWFNCVVRGDVFYIRIGERTNVQDGTVIHVSNGRHATIERSLVAAGSLLTPGTKIPPRSLVMGSPATVRRALRDEEANNLDYYWKNYVELSRIYKAAPGGSQISESRHH